jgi:phosphoglycolate phosphatase-like HAD superfamily hydrolase
MARAVLFDIDGTLIRTGGAGVKAFARAGENVFGIRNGTVKMKFAGRTDTGLVREFLTLHKLNPTPENIRRFLDAYVFWLDHLLPDAKGDICPGVLELIRDLRARKNPPLIGLLTGNIRLGAEIKLRQYGLWELFEFGAFADHHEDRDLIAHAARKSVHDKLQEAVHDHHLIVIGDTPHDVRCGRAIGAKVLAVATGGSTFAEIKATKADWVVNDLREITAAQLCGEA